MSMMSAPAFIIASPWALAASGASQRPPSEKESSVMLSTPITNVLCYHESPSYQSPSVFFLHSFRSSVRFCPIPPGKAHLRMVRQNQAHRLGPRGRVAHASSHRRGDGTGLRLLDATHGHAHVVAFGDHDHATRVDAFHQRVGHLLGEPLLHLRTACVQFHQPCQFA